MNKKIKTEYFLFALFYFYLAAVVWIILFKFSFSLSGLIHTQKINLIPFYGYLVSQKKLLYSDVINNVIIFIPFGIYIGALFPHWHISKKIISFFLVSLGLETLQYLWAIGRSDITDIITNSFGGVLGLAVFSFLALLCSTRQKAVKTVTLLAFAGSSFMSCILLLLLIMS